MPYDPSDYDETDLSQPANDTYWLARQWLWAHANVKSDDLPTDTVFGNRVQLGDRDVWEGEEQIPQLVGQILSYGSRYYPVSAYPKFTPKQIGTAYALWQRMEPDLGLGPRFAKALQDAHDNGNTDPRT